MKNQPALNWLIPLVAILALVTALAGLFWQDAGSPFTFTSLHGLAVEMYGQGLYRYDTLFSGAAFRGTDAVTLLIGLPLLIIATLLYRGGSLRGSLLLSGALAFFLYNGALMTLRAAYNILFLLYVAIFLASLFAFVLALAAIEHHDYRDLHPPASNEARLLREADMLEMLGVVGLVGEFVWGPNNLAVCRQRVSSHIQGIQGQFSLPKAQALAANRLERMAQAMLWLDEESFGEY
jgi:hypothetical protein